MKRDKIKKGKGVVKGAPSGFILSLMIHAVAFMLAGLLVVFTVHNKEEKKFVPPKPVERPKMKLKKPKVKVKKSAKPKATTRIVTKVKRASMPDIQLPEMSGMAAGLAGGIGGFEIMPDLGEVTLFGGGATIGSDFVGTFYDFKRTRTGRPTPMDPDNFRIELGRFVRNNLRTSQIAKYYRSPKKLYATTFTVPAIVSSVAPAAFGEEDTLGYCWVAHYKGQLVHKEDIRFRFRGMGDDVMLVQVDGKIVLNACWPGDSEIAIAGQWQSSSADSRKFRLGNNDAVVGDWIELKAGEAKDMQVIIGEVPGGVFASMLVVEVDGVEYERNSQGGPLLPIFKTAEPSLNLLDRIYETHIRDQAAITNGPIFNDLGSRSGASSTAVVPEVEPMPAVGAVEKEETSRLWTTRSGKSFEGEYVSVMGDKVMLKSTRGKQIRMPYADLSENDRAYIELSNPPQFKMSGVRQSSQRFIDVSPYNNRPPPKIIDYTFGGKINQSSARPYNHELFIEYYAIGQQYFDDDTFVLLDRQSSSFMPTKENDRSHAFSGEEVALMSYDLTEQIFGNKYYGYVMKLVDSRGETIQIQASSKWMEENVKNLEKIQKGWFIDKTCQRVFPSGPKRNY
jgi:hypothetical protein